MFNIYFREAYIERPTDKKNSIVILKSSNSDYWKCKFCAHEKTQKERKSELLAGWVAYWLNQQDLKLMSIFTSDSFFICICVQNL